MRLRLMALIGACCLMLGGCTKVVAGQRDEIRLYDWETTMENGNKATLSFYDGEAAFTAENSDFSLDITGICSLTDDSLVIINEEDDVSYRFDYVLHGDCVELSYEGAAVTLEKKVED